MFPWFSNPTLHPSNGTILNHPTLGVVIRASPAPGNILTASLPSSYPCMLQSPLLPLTFILCHPTAPPSTVSLHPLPPNTFSYHPRRHPPLSLHQPTRLLSLLISPHPAVPAPITLFHSTARSHHPAPSIPQLSPTQLSASNTVLHRLLLPGDTPCTPFVLNPLGPCS